MPHEALDQEVLEERQCMGLAMVQVLERLAGYYETPEECVEWFRSPQPLLGDETPINLIAAGRMNDVLRVWDRIDAGAYL